jgi:hypothetical protein
MRRGNLRGLLVGLVRGEKPTAWLANLRQAGAAAYSLAEEADEVRAAPDWDPWRADRSTQLFLVCAWVAYASQLIGDRLIEADAQADPLTADRAPAGMVEFARECYALAAEWVSAARFAQATPSFKPPALPATLPRWRILEVTTAGHVEAFRQVFEAVGTVAQYELEQLKARAAQHGAELDQMSLVAARMRTAADRAAALATNARGFEQLHPVREALIDAIEEAFLLGQLVAAPTLAERVQADDFRAGTVAQPPSALIRRGWPVVDRDDLPIGTVSAVEGDPALGAVSGIRIDIGPSFACRRARRDQIRAIGVGVVRLAVTKDALEAV